MSKHFLKRNPDNEAVCACGFRPDILDDPSPVGKQWKAKTAVLDHVKAFDGAGTEPWTAERSLTEHLERVHAIRGPAPVAPTLQRSPEAPFSASDGVKYPRAGVRRTADGRWLLTLWDGDQIVHVIDQEDRTHNDPYTAFSQGWLTVGACRQSGTNLNGFDARG
jgi:hypothetical protein